MSTFTVSADASSTPVTSSTGTGETVTGKPPTIAVAAARCPATTASSTCAEATDGHTTGRGTWLGICGNGCTFEANDRTGTDRSGEPPGAAATATGGRPTVTPATNDNTSTATQNKRDDRRMVPPP